MGQRLLTINTSVHFLHGSMIESTFGTAAERSCVNVCVNTEAGRAAYHMLSALVIILMCTVNTGNLDDAASCSS